MSRTTYLDRVEGYLDSRQLADLLRIKRTSIHRYRARGDIPPPDETVGRTPLWAQATIDKWLAGRPGHGWRKGQSSSQPSEETDQ